MTEKQQDAELLNKIISKQSGKASFDYYTAPV